jgi:hypothetical protein
VSVPRQFDPDYPRITNFFQGPNYRGKVDFALAELKVLVNPTTHVLDVNILQPGGPLAEFLSDRQLALAMEVADVDREFKAGRVDPPVGDGLE